MREISWRTAAFGCYTCVMTELKEKVKPAAPASKSERPVIHKRKFLIMPSFQLQLIFSNIVVIFCVLIVVIYQSARAIDELTTKGTKEGFAPDHPYFRFIRELSGSFYLHIMVAFVAGMIVSWLLTLFISHRFAGPIYRLRTYFEGLAGGDTLRDISFRKTDFLSDFAVVINQALKKVKGQDVAKAPINADRSFMPDSSGDV